MRRLFLGLLCFMVVPVFAAQPLNTIIAVVDDVAITALEVERVGKRLSNANPSWDARQAKRQALDNLIDRKIMLERARRSGIGISEMLLEQRLGDIRREINLTEDQLEGYAREIYNLSYAGFRQYVREEMIIQALFYREVYLNTGVYEDELEKFLMTETDVGIKRQYHFGHVLIAIKSSDPAAVVAEKRVFAEELHTRLQAGEDFGELARLYSDDKQAAAGDLGFRTEKELPAVFTEQAHNLKVGELAEVIETARGFHLIRLLGERGGKLREEIQRFRISHIFLPLGKRAEADKLYNDLTNGALSYHDAVRTYTADDVSRPKGGDIGWFTEEELPAYFVTAVAALQPDDISPPVESPFGLHILKLTAHTTDDVNMEQMRDRASRILRERRAQAQQSVWLRRLRGGASVRILDPDYLPDDN